MADGKFHYTFRLGIKYDVGNRGTYEGDISYSKRVSGASLFSIFYSFFLGFFSSLSIY